MDAGNALLIQAELALVGYLRLIPFSKAAAVGDHTLDWIFPWDASMPALCLFKTIQFISHCLSD